MTQRQLTRLFVIALLVGVAPTADAQPRQAGPDSVRAVLGLGSADKGLVELRGETVNDFRLYLGADTSRVGWWLEDTLYLYTLRGAGHDARAMQLFALLRQNGLASFLTERHGKRPPGMSPAVEVRALQMATIPGTITDESPRLQD